MSQATPAAIKEMGPAARKVDQGMVRFISVENDKEVHMEIYEVSFSLIQVEAGRRSSPVKSLCVANPRTS